MNYAGLVQCGGALQNIYEFETPELMEEWIESQEDFYAYRRVALSNRVLKSSLPHHKPIKTTQRIANRLGNEVKVWFYNEQSELLLPNFGISHFS